MKSLNHILRESLLDDVESIVKQADTTIINLWIEKHATGKYSAQILKNGNIKINGKFVIKGFEGDELPEFLHIISVINGGVFIEKCPNLKNISNLFDRFCKFEGDLSINNCPKLDSLVGCPFSVKGTFSAVGNKSLKKLDGMPEIVDDATYIMKNGKKFKEEYIKSFSNLSFNIFCSNETDAELVESIVNEALNEPHLLELERQLKKDGKSFKLLHEVPIRWDQIDSTDVTTFSKIDQKAITLARNVISGRTPGILLLKDYNGYFGIVRGKSYMKLRLNKLYFTTRTSTDILSYVESSDSMIYIEYDVSDRINMISQRIQDREGVIWNDPEQNKKIAAENLQRYKTMAAKIKAEKNATYNKIDDEVENILTKLVKINREAHKNPDKINKYDLSYLNSQVYGQSQWVGFSKQHPSGYKGTDGILYLYDQYTTAYIRISQQDGTNYDVRRLKECEEQIFDLISKAKDLISDLGF